MPIKYTQKQISKLLLDLHRGVVTELDLPEDLYYAIKDYLKNGLYKGYGGTIEDFKGIRKENLEELTQNIDFFSAAKTFNFIKEAGDLLVGDDGVVRSFNEFKTEAEALYGKYNEDWLEAEYNTTIGSAQMAERWQGIEENKDILPMLTFSTDGTPCPECAPFEGLTAPVEDPIWDEATPLLHFNCECILIQSDDAAPTSKDDIDNLPMDTIPDMFRNNPGKTGEIFTKDHPYFDVPAEYQELARENFGLPIGEE
jgi:hypothetical protein